MAGLPKKYAKMGFAKGWKAFKAAKSKLKRGRKKPMRTATTRKPKISKKKTTARKTTRTIATKTARKRRSTVRRNSVNKAMISKLQQAGIGVSGAIGARVVSNLIPVNQPIVKAGIPAALGVVMMAMSGKSKMLEALGFGMAAAGGLNVAQTLLPKVSLMQGDENVSLPITTDDVEQALIEGAITPNEAQALLENSPELMGAVESFAGEQESFAPEYMGDDWTSSEEYEM